MCDILNLTKVRGGIKEGYMMNSNDFQSVIEDEYNTVFEFYVYQLGFQYIKGNIAQINRHIHSLENSGQAYKVIDKVKCGNDLIVYTDEI